MALSTITITPEWDPDLDGSYSSMITDGVLNLGDVAQMRFSSGCDYDGGRFQPRTADLNLNLRNPDGLLTPRYSSSLLFGRQLRHVPIRVKATHNAITYDVWRGYIRHRQRVWERGRKPRMSISARGLMGILRDTRVTVENSGAPDIDGAMAKIFDACGNVVSGDYALTDSTQGIDLFFGDDRPAGEMLAELNDCEMGGLLFEANGGKPTFTPRGSLLGLTLADSSADTWGAGTDIQPVTVIEDDNDDDLITSVKVTTHSYDGSDGSGNTVVYNEGLEFTTAHAMYLSAGQAVGPRALLPNVQGVLAIYSAYEPTCEPYVDYRANASADGSGADRTANVSITFHQVGNQWYYWIRETTGSTDAYLGHLWIRGDGALDIGGAVEAYDSEAVPTGSDDSTIGAVAWTNPTNISSSNNTYATVTLTAGQTSHYLQALLPIAGIPSQAIINGIAFQVEAKRGSGTGTQAITVRALKAGTVQTGSRTMTVTTSEGYLTFGGPGELWGVQWAPADLADANFGCMISVESALADTYSVDHVQVIVYYTLVRALTNSARTNLREIALPAGLKGGRKVDLNLPWVSNQDTARDYAEQVLRIGRYGSGIVRMAFQLRNDATAVAMLTADIGRLVKYTMKTGLSADGDNYSSEYFRIISKDMVLVPTGLHHCVVSLMPAFNFRNLSKIAWDDFVRADSATLGKTPTGDTWALDSGSWEIASNKARPTGGDIVTPDLASFDLGSTDFVVEMGLSNMDSDTNQIIGFVFRRYDASNYWYAVIDKAANRVLLGKYVAGVPTVANYVYTPGDTAEIRVITQGDRIRVWADGRLMADTTDSTHNTRTYVGVYSRRTTSVTVNNFYVQALLA